MTFKVFQSEVQRYRKIYTSAMARGTRFAEFQTGEDWSDYVDRFDQHCIANDIVDTDAKPQKRALFLSCVGPTTYKLIKTLLAPDKATDKKYEDLCKLVEDHVAPKPIVIAERYNFYTRKQKEGESVSQYLTELHKLAETCEFGAFLDQALRDIFVIGLNDRQAQQRLLSDKEKKTMADAFEVALSYERAHQHVDTLQGDSKVKKVEYKKGEYKRRSFKECFRCGRNNHRADDCYFQKTKCYICEQVGHIQSKCPKNTGKREGSTRQSARHHKHKYGKKKSSEVKKVAESDTESLTSSYESGRDSDCEGASALKYVRGVTGRNSEIKVQIKINEVPVRMELDTGAAVSLMPEQMKNELLPKTKLKTSDITLRTVTGEKVKVLGKCKVQVTYEGQVKEKMPLYIVEAKGPALFGRDWLSKIKLDWEKIVAVKKIETVKDNELKQVLLRYDRVFGKTLGKIQGVQATLQLKEKASPKFFKARPVPFAVKKGIETELHRLENEGVIERIQYSDWAAPIVPVKKPSGEIRICGDYKVTVNQALQVPQHPIPRAEELFQALNGGEKFTKLDLSQAYQQVELDPESKKYVSINTHLGLYAYRRLPYGISSAPAIFQAVMDKILQGLNVGCYLDDIVITGRNDKEHLQNLEKVLARLQEANVRLRQDKCVFMAPSITYLGFTINHEGVRMDTAGTEAVREAPRPCNKAELQSFLGLVNHYRKHIPNMSTMCSPLNQLLKKDYKWQWNQETEQAFLSLKQLLTTRDTVLVHYDPEKEVTLNVDASPVGLGAVLSQVTEKGEQPVAYASHSLTSCERKYAQLEKEGLAIIFGLKRFHQYLHSRKFTLVTDNKPLSLILGPKKGIPVLAAARIQRWAIQLAAYDYELVHRPADQNCHADALSRLPLPTVEEPERSINWTAEGTEINRKQLHQLPITARSISKEVRKEALLSKVLFLTQNGWPEEEEIALGLKPYYSRRHEISIEEGCLLWGTRTIIPPKFQETVLEELHANHPGIVKMKSLARMHVWWPSIEADVEQTVRLCNTCQSMQPRAPAAEANPWQWPSRPWHRVHVDFAGPYMGENFFIIVDAHSKWPMVYRMKSTTAEKTVEKLRTLFADYGLPHELVSDNGPQFVSDIMKQFLRDNNVKHILSAPYHPSSNGEAERFVQTFKRAMKAKRTSKASWNHKISEFLLSYRTTPHTTTKCTPSELMFGRTLRTRLDAVHPNIGRRIQQSTSPESPPRQLSVGDPVLVRDYRNKKENWARGVILKKLGPCTYSVLVGDLEWKRHIDQLRLSTDGVENPVPYADEIQSPKPQVTPSWTAMRDHHSTVLTSDVNSIPETSVHQNSSPRPQQNSGLPIPDESGSTTKDSVDLQPQQSENGTNDRVVNQPQRKSTRMKQPPGHLKDYVL